MFCTMNVLRLTFYLDKIRTLIKRAYEERNIPTPYPAANKQLQDRLRQFVCKGRNYTFSLCISLFLGIADDQSATKFDKVHSHRAYFLEKHNDVVHLMVEIPDKNQEMS